MAGTVYGGKANERLSEMLLPFVRQEIQKELGTTSRGRKILALQAEKDNLEDTIWLATSGKQVKEFWEKLDGLLGSKPTKLQREALELEPVSVET